LWWIGYIWHIDNSDDHRDWFGFWDGSINLRVTPVGVQADGFDFSGRMTTARNAWSSALGITINNATDAATANIRAYGGHRDEIQDHLRRTAPFTDRYGTTLLYAPIDGGVVGTIQAGGVSRNVFRLRGTGSNANIIAVFSDSGSWLTFDSRNINFATMAAMHELGHALGYFGHSPNSNDVMRGNIPLLATPNETLNPAEIEHLRQIYQRFRS